MIRYFPEEVNFEGPYEFTDPFRYAPHPLVIKAGQEIMKAAPECFAEGKMLGVLVCREEKTGKPGYLAAFSGTVRDSRGEVTATVPGFVPPIYDLTDPEGEFKTREAEITQLNTRIEHLLASPELQAAQKQLTESELARDEDISRLKAEMAAAKEERDRLRRKISDERSLSELTRQSQHAKAELRRAKLTWESRIAQIKSSLTEITEEIESLKKQRASMSEALQDWIFRQYIVHNPAGEELSIAELFARKGLIPPGGTGECAAPKLLEYALSNGLQPLAMGEFWYGRPSQTAVRIQGHFYPSCTSKCGPLLEFMLKGLKLLKEDVSPETPIIIYEDDSIIVVEKPSGMPSVPGLDGRQSLQEWLTHRQGCQTHQVHRLDMDTSGVMVFAKKASAAASLRQQFEGQEVRKTYLARTICPPSIMSAAESGTIDLPLGADYDERPRQKVDLSQGKPAYTEYHLNAINPDGTADLMLTPHTGRTHQLRVHCAHTLGLGSPILGDLLYGGAAPAATRLHLHALSIVFRHPAGGEEMTFTSRRLCYN